jgi:hypothetical protein
MGSNRTQKIKINRHCREHYARYPQKVEKTYHTISPHGRKLKILQRIMLMGESIAEKLQT